MNTNVSVREDFDGVVIRIQIPREELYLFTDNQIQMLHLANEKPVVDQLRIIFIMLLEVLSRGKKNG